MAWRVSVDRYEGRDGEIAVLATEDGRPILLPREVLPAGVAPGDLLTLSFRRAPAATKRIKAQTRRTTARLKRRDPGGDVEL